MGVLNRVNRAVIQQIDTTTVTATTSPNIQAQAGQNSVKKASWKSTLYPLDDPGYPVGKDERDITHA